MRRAERLYRLTDLLRSRRRAVTAAWLAKQLDVTPRTIYRDIADLMTAGVPVVGEAGVGYVLRRRIDLPPLMLDREELAAVEAGLRFVRAHADAALGPAAARALAKIRGVVPRDVAGESVPLYVSRRRTPAAALLVPVLRAVDTRRKLALEYSDEGGRETSRTVRPLAVLFAGVTWTVVAWDELRDDFRSFRGDRIRELRVLDETYPDEPGRRLDDFFRDMESRYGVAVTEFDPDR